MSKRDLYIKAVSGVAPAVSRSTATLMKTGQTTSYRTGDDGDIQAGRTTNFFTLDTAPVHNNGSPTLNTTTNRFTDELGGQTYTNNIVLDWSTWNGSTLLGWRRTENSVNIIWDDAIDEALTLSIGGFSSGWRLPNQTEIMSIACPEASSARFLGFAPFNNNSNSWLWTGSVFAGTAAPMALGNQPANGLRARLATTLTASRYIPCRTFSLSTSNILS